jgi:hypothetical protein
LLREAKREASMTQNVLELWEQQSGATGSGAWRELTKERVVGTFRERLQAFRRATERRIDDWIGLLDDAQSRPDRDF